MTPRAVGQHFPLIGNRGYFKCTKKEQSKAEINICSAGLFVLSYRKIFISCGPFSQSQCLEKFMAVNVQKPRFEQIASGALV